jgi:hypothetical protein
MENRHGLVVGTRLTHATGTAEREAGMGMLSDLPAGGRITVGGDKLFKIAPMPQISRASATLSSPSWTACGSRAGVTANAHAPVAPSTIQ